MTITFPRAALLFVALVAVLLPGGFTVAQNSVSPSASTANDQQDPVVCFDQTLRNAVNGVQAYPAYLPSLWQQARQCRGRGTAQLDACWTTLMEAGPLIQRAGQMYELARHSGTQAQAEPLDREGQALMAQAERLVIDAETCFDFPGLDPRQWRPAREPRHRHVPDECPTGLDHCDKRPAVQPQPAQLSALRRSYRPSCL